MRRERSLTSHAIAAIVLAGALIHAAGAQAPRPAAPQFRAGTDLVQVEVSVLDNKRQPVRGLTAADFTLLDNGVARPIDAFAEIALPPSQPAGADAAEAAWTREVPADVTTNHAAAEEGRLVVILMDRLITVGPPTFTARKVAARLIGELGPGDLAAVVSTSGGTTQNLTSDKTRLLKAVTQANAGTRSTEDITDTDALTAFYTFTPMNEGECLCGLCVLDTITRVAEAVQDVSRRRKSLFFIGSDIVFQSGDSPDASAGVGCGIRLADAREVMFKAVDRANLTIHSIDPAGLDAVGPTSRASSNLPGRSPVGLNAQARQASALGENLAHQEALRVLPSHTGGRAVMNTNAPEEIVPAMLRESGAYYVLGFRPAQVGGAPAFRNIEVKVARKGVQVHARSGYTPVVASAATATAGEPGPAALAPTALAAALTAPLPNDAVPLTINTGVFATPGSPRATVALAIGIDTTTGAMGAPGVHESLDIVAGAFDQSGRSVASARQTMQVVWPAVGAGGPLHLDLLTHLDLPPGDYEIRAAVGTEASSRPSSVFTFVTVPDFGNEPLSLSTIAVAGGASAATLRDDTLSARMPLSMSTQRAFSQTDRLMAFLRVYQGTRRADPAAPVHLQLRVLDAHGRVAAQQVTDLTAAQFMARTADYFIQVPLTGLAPGEYLLQVEATAAGRTAGRAVRFTVKGQ